MSRLSTRVAAVAALSTLALAGTLATATPAEAAAFCRTSFTTYAAVTTGSSGSAAGAVQCLLGRAGYSVKIDRSFSAADAKQLKAFQTRSTLTASGRADGRTWAALIARGSKPVLRPGSTGADVVRLQLTLRALGHTELPGTTTYGTLTTKAVKAFQKSLGWKQTGIASAGVWSALQIGGRAPVVKASSTSKGARALAFAKHQIGDKYKYGASGPDTWDCSGLTMMAWKSVGVNLAHSTTAQYKVGKKIAKADLRPGDLVFFYSGISHVGIYAGDGLVVHSPKPGSKVTTIPIKYMPYQGARRPG